MASNIPTGDLQSFARFLEEEVGLKWADLLGRLGGS